VGPLEPSRRGSARSTPGPSWRRLSIDGCRPWNKGHEHADETNHTQKTISSTVKIYYCFHPLHGQELQVLNSPKDGEGAVTVEDLTGAGLKISSTQPKSNSVVCMMA